MMACENCGTNCQLETLVGRYCGDGTLDNEEVCDEGSRNGSACAPGELSCEVCTLECQRAQGQTSSCGDTAFQNELVNQIQLWMSDLTEGVDTYPTAGFQVPEATMGTLSLGLNPNAFTVLGDAAGIYAAGSQLGSGRIIAYAGQDFISSHVRSTLLARATPPNSSPLEAPHCMQCTMATNHEAPGAPLSHLARAPGEALKPRGAGAPHGFQ